MGQPSTAEIRPGSKRAYEIMAEAFAREGVDHHFLLMGHGQMFWAVAMDALPGMRSINTRHEHCAVSAATGYHYATGKIGVASVTCGPGFTQIMTALTSAAQARVPLVVLAADSPASHRWYNQTVDQSALARATGAAFVGVRSASLLPAHIQDAFYIARTERRPVVLNVPYDLMMEELPVEPYVPSSDLVPRLLPIMPNPGEVEVLAQRLQEARFPILVAGRGAVRSGAGPAIAALAEKSGALLATTLPARGLFDDDPFSVGVAGGFSSDVARECFARADLVIAVGASLTNYTVDSGALFPQAEVAQIDEAPRGLKDGRRSAQLHLRADARLGIEALSAAISVPTRSEARSETLRRSIAEAPADATQFEIEPGLMDPRQVVAELDRIIPKDWDIVAGTGHSSYFYSHLKGRSPERHHVLREFGAIGSTLPMALGVAAARGNGKVALLDGDGGLMMHLQELESIERQGIRLLIIALNDGGYGAEIHKLRNVGADPSMAIFGRPDFASMARGFKLDGETITSTDQFAGAFARYDPESRTAVWDVHITDRVASPRGRKKPL